MVTTQNLESARKFWVAQLGFHVIEERPDEYFIVDAGGLRLWVDLKESEERVVRGSDPAIGLQVRSVKMVLERLAARGISEKVEPLSARTGLYTIIHDPDGRAVVLTETGQ
ncbi:MAG: Glyoxalase/Bleomycin resistance protein/Dioxygenase superfamily [Gammaproteobacteria bacterium]|jgi:catechol 2,3-dioxygenase-like lactoylglutathione lyase family enzyme|nr:Glyoxalase/Bleomycin resistance protein/Dioxygenase superfamily [Gammaproteobacteria bacterium]